ncbi:MAG: endonuclease III [Verrucomicrobia bacterium]|jgi:endonuclease-3|nr:endonuclease III [Verrucomicrobiota bacterium]MBT5064437.1 endonuclease III [Verrucomicrobiota bacterium]MBT5479501.1 endonuclease III [Verrucomicrobiota bacterium]MBT6240293.1 endonuclease III [Verrucomicrobiota bacterium]MBT6804517.1 endonuclease III [Verrucomicrobiota bacterium]
MPRESLQSKKDRMQLVIRALRKTYPDAHCELVYKNPLELLIATILSAQCTDKQVNIVTSDLFEKYKTAQDYAVASQEALENDIRRIGLFRSKARNIRLCSQKLVEDHRGQVPETMEELVQLGGVGRKTANVVLGNAFEIQVGIVVDTHVKRLSERLRFSRANSAEKVEQDLQKLVAPHHWTMFSHWLIWHGRRRCAARSPQCASCEIKDLCPSNASSQ